jgi:hypothetical protein
MLTPPSGVGLGVGVGISGVGDGVGKVAFVSLGLIAGLGVGEFAGATYAKERAVDVPPEPVLTVTGPVVSVGDAPSVHVRAVALCRVIDEHTTPARDTVRRSDASRPKWEPVITTSIPPVRFVVDVGDTCVMLGGNPIETVLALDVPWTVAIWIDNEVPEIDDVGALLMVMAVVVSHV